MEFLNPIALLGLLALPLLLIPYLIRRKPRRMVFSSVLLFVASGAQASGRPWGRVNLPPILFLQLLLLALLVLALSEPVFSVRPTKIAIVLDNSASMQALENGRTRMELAQHAADSVISEIGSAGQVDLYLTTPRLAMTAAAALSPTQARAIIARIGAYDFGDPSIEHGAVLERLAREQKYERVYVITDHPARGHSATVRVITVGRTHGNLALTGFEVQRSSLANARMEAIVKIANFSDRSERAKILLKANGAVLANRDLSVEADGTATANFEGFTEHPTYEAAIESGDVLPLDNRRFTVGPGSRNLQVLAVTPRPQEIRSLRSIPGLALELVSPAEYENSQRTGHGLEIFHFSAPATLPRNPALFILPPENHSLAKPGAPESNVTVSSWREPHTLTRYINFSLFRPTYARPLKPESPGEVVIESPNGALAFATERQGVRYLTLGFDPFPYLGRDNLPMSVFTLNLLDWFFDTGVAGSQGTGEPISLGIVQSGETLTTPRGEKIELKSGMTSFSETFYQGIYRRSRPGQDAYYARNLLQVHESDLRANAPILLEAEAGDTSSPSVLFSFWPYLLAAALLLFAFEWLIGSRMHFRSQGVRRQPVRVDR